MWSPDGNKPSISPILLSKFNPFDILLPQKTEGVVHGPQVDKLIDIEDFSLDADVNASLMDQKTDYDLVDLYQNMYVTPQHVKLNKKEHAVAKNNNITNSIDYKDFFDKLESGKKFDWTNEDSVPKRDDIDMGRKPKVLVPKVSLDDDIDPEDLLEEILSKKSMEKHILDDLKARNKVSASLKQNKDCSEVIQEYPRLKVLNVPSNIDLEKPSSSTNVSITFTKDTASQSKNTNTKSEITTEFSRLKLNNSLNGPKVDNNIKIYGQINNSANFKVIAIKKDEKVYKKKRVLKPESQTASYTKGPDFEEKSVVLPQIMARIKTRQAYLEERGNQKKRFVLDTSGKTDENSDKVKKSKDVGLGRAVAEPTPHNSGKNVKKSAGNDKNPPSTKAEDTWGKVFPIVLMADCNKERLRAFKRGRMFQDFVLNGK